MRSFYLCGFLSQGKKKLNNGKISEHTNKSDISNGGFSRNKILRIVMNDRKDRWMPMVESHPIGIFSYLVLQK